MSEHIRIPQFDALQQNILATYARATDADIMAGRTWYPLARKIARRIGRGDVAKGAGVIAAFSPMMAWKLNLALASNCTRSGVFTGHFGANNRKARAIWRGANPDKVLGGQKVRAFYQCIVSAGECDAVCLDRHALAIALGRLLDDNERKRYGKSTRVYRRISEAYRTVAQGLGYTPAELQAVCWVTHRREKGITD